MKSLFTFNAGFSKPSFMALDGPELSQDEPTTMPDTSETGPLMYMPPTQTSSPNPWGPVASSVAKAAAAIKFPNLVKPQASAAPAPSAPSGAGTALAIVGGAAALGLVGWMIFRKK